jgi:transcription initiation factor TFIIIB Brf1 subunit/transcription initiation factor TFIIB
MRECFECGSSSLATDGLYLYCKECGTVLKEQVLMY